MVYPNILLMDAILAHVFAALKCHPDVVKLSVHCHVLMAIVKTADLNF